MTTAWKKIDNFTTEIRVDSFYVGTVEATVYMKWKINPNFNLSRMNKKALKKEYDNDIEAGRVLAEMWNNTWTEEVPF
jgi:hypothetical protein